MITLDLTLDSTDELFAIGNMLLELEKEMLNDDDPVMQEITIIKDEYEITLDFGYLGLDECIVRRKHDDYTGDDDENAKNTL
jgi:hypothetical protein